MPRRAGAKRRECGLYDRELSAGAAFVLAGFSAGTGVCARGGTAAGNSECGVWNAKLKRDGRMEKRRRPAIAENPFHTLRFMFRSIRVQASGNLLQRFTRLTPVVCRVSAKQDGLRQAAFLFRAGRDCLSTFSDGAGLSCILGLLQVCPFLYGDPDGERSEPRIRQGTPCWVGVPFDMVMVCPSI